MHSLRDEEGKVGSRRGCSLESAHGVREILANRPEGLLNPSLKGFQCIVRENAGLPWLSTKLKEEDLVWAERLR